MRCAYAFRLCSNSNIADEPNGLGTLSPVTAEAQLAGPRPGVSGAAFLQIAYILPTRSRQAHELKKPCYRLSSRASSRRKAYQWLLDLGSNQGPTD